MINGKKIVLTGANSGIGLETLKLLIKGDNQILAVDLHDENINALASQKVTTFLCDVGTKDGVDSIFDKATEVLGDIDIFYANAGFPYFEKVDYTDWDRIDRIFSVNTYSPIYTYMKYIAYKNGKPGHYAMTVSAIGKMAMPGYALYSATKFAVQGFQQAIRLEKPANVKLTCLYPVATNTGFFKAGAEGLDGRVITKKPFPVQQPSVVARKMVRGIERGKKYVNPCFVYEPSRALFAICPPIRTIYWALENKKFKQYWSKENLK